jgi:hypothetical protein
MPIYGRWSSLSTDFHIYETSSAQIQLSLMLKCRNIFKNLSTFVRLCYRLATVLHTHYQNHFGDSVRLSLDCVFFIPI